MKPQKVAAWMRIAAWMAVVSTIAQPVATVPVIASQAPMTRPADKQSKNGLTIRAELGVGSASVATVASALASADVALARSLITPSLLRGDVTEELVNGILSGPLLRRYVESGGGWQMVRPRWGRQGLDGALVRLDARGDPRALMVAETKYNSSQLGMTQDGVQMSMSWRSTRLAALADRYLRLHDQLLAGQVVLQRPPSGLTPHRQLDVPLSGRRNAIAWMDGKNWKLSAAPAELSEATFQAGKLEKFLSGAATGRISYRSRIFVVTPHADRLAVRILDAGRLDQGLTRLFGLEVMRSFNIPLDEANSFKLRRLTEEQIGSALRGKLPHLSADDREVLARGAAKAVRDLDRSMGIFGGSATGHIVLASMAAGGVAAILDPVISAGLDSARTRRLRFDPHGLPMSMSLSFFATTGGVATGQGTVILLTRNAILNQFAQRGAGALGVSTSVLTTAAGELAGGSAASVLFAWAAYGLGRMDAETARRSGAAGIIGTGAGALAGIGTISLIGAYGTASTGVAISSLSGAAATSATAAWLGGGSVAAGGGGAAVGSIVFTGGVMLVVIGVGAGVMYGFHYHDELKEAERMKLTIEDLRHRVDLSDGRFAPAR